LLPHNEFSRLLLQTKIQEEVGDTGLFRLSYFRWVWEPASEGEVTVATKADDAGINRSLWAAGGDSSGMEEARELIRRVLHRAWYRRLEEEAKNYYRARLALARQDGVRKSDLDKDKEAIDDCLMRSRRSTWWDWGDGSRLYFWRWLECWQEEARNGAKPFHVSRPPRRPVARKICPETPWHQDRIDEKIGKLIERRYLRKPREGQPVQVSIPYFPVQKGEDDARVVGSNTENGVNGSIYVPRMWMPTGDTMTRNPPPPMDGWAILILPRCSITI
jgi:hypothetical protein